MLVEKFVVPANELDEVGLQAIEMSRLGRFVALAGKNGAGKTRLLAKLDFYLSARNGQIGNLTALLQNIQDHNRTIDSIQIDHPHWKAITQNLVSMQTQYMLATERVYSPTSSVLGVLRFVPKQLILADPRQHHKSALQGLFGQAKNPGLNGIETSCFSYVQMLQNRSWEATHQDSTLEPTEIQEAKDEYMRLVLLIELLLKTRLGRSKDADAMLFGKPLAEASLSDGQKVLIQLAVALHAQNATLDNTVFLLDEPENHLHPSALIEFLDALEQVATNAQFWIATHSVPLLAHIAHKEPMSIWYVEDGKVSNAGSKPEKVLHGLLGNDEQIGNLNAFTSLPAQYAAINYAAECLLVPKVVETEAGDPQIAQIGGVINFNAETPTSLLDYGAGKSRLLSGLFEIAAAQVKSLSDSVSYFVFDTSESDRISSLAVIDSVYGNSAERHFLCADEFYSKKDNGSIDIVVMCNVLHEIPPNEWPSLFNAHSLIGRSLKDSGFLLVVEDQRIPTGEKAHQFGFLVLDTAHIRTLFAVSEADIKAGLFQVYDQRGDGRLKAHKISKQLLSRLSADTRKHAIEQLRETAKFRINELRQAAANYKNGQLHGFWTQQFANAALFLDGQ